MLTTLVMHRVVKGSPVEWTDVSEPVLHRMLDLIRERKLTAASAGAWESGPAICLSFDDGSISDYSIVFPAVAARGLCASFFVVPAWVGTPGYVTWEHLREMHRGGMEIGSHSLSHPQISRLSAAEARREFIDSRKLIEDNVGCRVSVFAYPYGDYSTRCNQLAWLAGYERVCTSRPGFGRENARILPRISVNRRHGLRDLCGVVEPGLLRVLWLDAFERTRSVAKTMLGRKVYVRVRNALFR